MCRLFFSYNYEPSKMRELLNEAFLQAHIGKYIGNYGPTKDGYGIHWRHTRRGGRRSRCRRARTYKNTTSYLVNPEHDCVVKKIGTADLVLCHLRTYANTLAHVDIRNTHPFVWRDIAFVHNGELLEFVENRVAILREMGEKWSSLIRGETDTEHLFYLWLSYLNGAEGAPAGVAALKKVVAFLKYLNVIFRLNFIIVARDYWIASRIIFNLKPIPKKYNIKKYKTIPLFILRGGGGGGGAAPTGDKVLISTNKLIPHQKMIGKNKIVYGHF